MKKNKITIYDAIMGSGKTHKAIKRMNEYVDKGVKFIYITPFKTEITRVKNELPENSVFIPLSKDDDNSAVYEYQINYLNEDKKIDINNPKVSYKYLNKRTQLLKFADKDKSIIATHSLFNNLKKEDYKFFKGYILILDEVINPLEIEYIGKKDISILQEQNLILIDEVSNEVKFINDDYNDNAFKKIKNLCISNTVYHLDEYFFVWIFPVDIFRNFKEIQILTYLFEGSLLSAYFKLYDLNYLIKRENSVELLKEFKELLNIYSGRSNKKKDEFSFSFSACKNSSKKKDKNISNTTSNVFKKVFKTGTKFNAFTTFKDNQSKFSGGGYTKGFIAVNARATNDFRHKKSMAYLANRYYKPQYISFFRERGITLNEDLWALSELVQWIWRGCIRDRKEMNLYIPSYRMRNLLLRWLDGEFIVNDIEQNDNKKIA